MKKTILSILGISLLSSNAFSLSINPFNPLPVAFKAKENGGSKDAIDAYQDGVGAMLAIADNSIVINNGAMNTLVFKYGVQAKENGVNLINQVQITGDTQDKLLADTMVVSFPDGTPCDDGNPSTVNDAYSSGVCEGILTISGTPGADNLVGSNGKDWIIGFAGNDTITSYAGNDIIDGGPGFNTINAGDGDDKISFNGYDLLIDGGNGFDTITLSSVGQNVDFSILSDAVLKNIEVIDLSVNGNHTLSNISLTDIIAMTDSRKKLYILGNNLSTVSFKKLNGWIKSGTKIDTINGVSYTFDIYLNSSDFDVSAYVQQELVDKIA